MEEEVKKEDEIGTVLPIISSSPLLPDLVEAALEEIHIVKLVELHRELEGSLELAHTYMLIPATPF